MGRHLPFSLPSRGSDAMDTNLTTERLTLRPLRLEDAPAVERYCGNWEIARMTSRIPHPYPEGLAADWIAGLEDGAVSGYRFAIEYRGELVGVIGLEQLRSEHFEIGYWIAEPWWGLGLATEAARRVVAFALDDLGLDQVVAGHFADNPASGRVLEKCGFRYSGEGREWSKARDGEVACKRFVLRRSDVRARQQEIRA